MFNEAYLVSIIKYLLCCILAYVDFMAVVFHIKFKYNPNMFLRYCHKIYRSQIGDANVMMSFAIVIFFH